MNKVTTYFIDCNAPQEGTESCNHTEELPSIPEMSPNLRSAINELEMLQLSSNKKAKKKRLSRPQAHRPSKIHGFTAYKSYYSRNLLSVSQGLISAVLSKAWAIEKNQHVWDLYAKLYRRYKRSQTFSEWLEENSLPTKGNNFEFDDETLNAPNDSSSLKYEAVNSLKVQSINLADTTLPSPNEITPSLTHGKSEFNHLTTGLYNNNGDFTLHLSVENNPGLSCESYDVSLSMINTSVKLSSSYNDLLQIFGPEWLQEFD